MKKAKSELRKPITFSVSCKIDDTSDESCKGVQYTSQVPKEIRHQKSFPSNETIGENSINYTCANVFF